jgi:hypothetical protein
VRLTATSAALVLALQALTACGDDDGQVTTATSASTAAVDEPAWQQLDVFAEAAVLGPLADVLRVTAHPPGVLTPTAPLQALVTFDATEDVSIAAFPFAAVEVDAEDGAGTLGVTGICGRGWRADGSRLEDPCSAAEPVASVGAGQPTTIPLTLFPRTTDGVAAAGRYVVIVPIADGGDGGRSGDLRLTLDVAPRDRDRLPPLDRTAALTVSLEEAPAELVGPGAPPLEVLVEDAFRRPLDRRPVADAAAAGGAYEVAVPAGVVHVVLVAPDGDGRYLRCGVQQALVDADRTITVLFDRLAVDGTCPGGELSFALDGLDVRLDLGDSVASGGELRSQLIVENPSGHDIVERGCQLGTGRYALVPVDDPDAELWIQPEVDCGGDWVIPDGFADTYDGPTFPATTRFGDPLPPGDYLAVVEIDGLRERLSYPVRVTG